MKIFEVLQPSDTFEVYKNHAIVELDRLFDTVRMITADFYVPIDVLNSDTIEEWQDELINILDTINKDVMSIEWLEKLSQLCKYFNVK